jgi:predicted Zn-ribbon and HTH transcriptional regulator
MALVEEVIRLLEEEELTAREICYRLGLEPEREKEIYAILDKVAKVAKRKGKRLMMIPPRCKNCGFTLNKPKASRCPKCKGERIEPARFTIK